MDSPLLSYIDIRHPNFLPPSFTIGEAWDFGPWIVRAKSLVLVRDDIANLISQNCTVHRPVGGPQTLVQPTRQVAAESVNSSEVETDQGEEEMVSKRTLTLERFLPGALTPPSSWPFLKKVMYFRITTRVSSDAPSRTPPLRVSGGVVI